MENVEPITGEWLVKLGFEEIETDEDCRYARYSLHLGEDYYIDIALNSFDILISLRSVSNIMPDDTFFLPNRIRYVHQLQNLMNCLR